MSLSAKVSSGRTRSILFALFLMMMLILPLIAITVKSQPVLKEHYGRSDGIYSIDVSIRSPISDEYVSGTYTFAAVVTTNSTVKLINITVTQSGGPFSVSGPMTYNSITDVYEYWFNTDTAPDGVYSVYVNATDSIGGTANDSVAKFYIDNNPPTLDILTPHQDYQLIEDVFKITVRSDDGACIELSKKLVGNVMFKIDAGEWLMLLGGAAPAWMWTANWNTASVADGNHIITVRSTDGSGVTVTQSRGVIVDNNPPDLFVVRVPPSPWTYPGVVDGVQNFTVQATDKVGLVKVIIFITNNDTRKLIIKGERLSINTLTGLYEYIIDLDMMISMDDGNYNWTITAFDLRNHTTSIVGKFIILKSPPLIMLNTPQYGSSWNDEWRAKEITTPQSGAVNFSVSVSVRAIGRNYPTTVYIKFDDGSWLDMNTILNTDVSIVGEYYYVWETTAKENGMHLIQFRVVDFVNHTAYDKYVITVKNPDLISTFLLIIIIGTCIIFGVAFTIWMIIKSERANKYTTFPPQQTTYPQSPPTEHQLQPQTKELYGPNEWKGQK